MEHRATRPKESSAAWRSLRIAEMPTPSAMMNGTVMGPVVTPPESNATARKSLGTKAASTNTMAYSVTSSGGSAILNSIRSSAITRKAPTPAATERINTRLGTDGTWLASTCKSGSDMVMMKPRIKPITIILGKLRLLVMAEPTRSPMGVMLISAPRVKNIMPKIIMTAPSRKHSSTLGDRGAMKKLRTSTIATIGKTACSASTSFSFSFSRNCKRERSTRIASNLNLILI